jgi:hypothetical protein
MVKDYLFGLMEQNMMESGKMAKDTEKEHKFSQMEQNMMDNGKMAKDMA